MLETPGSGDPRLPGTPTPEASPRDAPRLEAVGPAGRVCVLAPAALLTVTIEASAAGDDVHVHAGGQGFWIARLLRELGLDVVLCGAFGGEAGRVARTLIEDAGVTVRSVESAATSGSYVHDRRSGERHELAHTPAAPLSRHTVDELFGLVFVEGLDADLTILGGPNDEGIIPDDLYRRLAHDLRANGSDVAADLSGTPLRASLEGGLTLLKISDEELEREGLATVGDRDSIRDAILRLRDDGARNVVVTRAHDHTIALVDDELVEVEGPTVSTMDHRGAGDSLTAGVCSALARGWPLTEGLQLGSAAGSLNVTRHGLGTGTRAEIERVAERVQVRPLGAFDEEPRTKEPIR
jgi:1-phosphofructokinase